MDTVQWTCQLCGTDHHNPPAKTCRSCDEERRWPSPLASTWLQQQPASDGSGTSTAAEEDVPPRTIPYVADDIHQGGPLGETQPTDIVDGLSLTQELEARLDSPPSALKSPSPPRHQRPSVRG